MVTSTVVKVKLFLAANIHKSQHCSQSQSQTSPSVSETLPRDSFRFLLQRYSIHDIDILQKTRIALLTEWGSCVTFALAIGRVLWFNAWDPVQAFIENYLPLAGNSMAKPLVFCMRSLHPELFFRSLWRFFCLLLILYPMTFCHTLSLLHNVPISC